MGKTAKVKRITSDGPFARNGSVAFARRCVIGKSIKEMVGHRCIVAPFAGADANQMGPSGKEWHRSASASVEIVAFVNNATPAQSNYVLRTATGLVIIVLAASARTVQAKCFHDCWDVCRCSSSLKHLVGLQTRRKIRRRSSVSVPQDAFHQIGAYSSMAACCC